MKRAETGESAPTAAECVLWHRRGVQPPVRLVEALHRRSIRVERATDRFLAFSALLLMARRAPDSPVVLLLVDPQSLRGAAAVVRAVERFVPRAPIWVYDESSDPHLRAVRPEDVAQWAAAPEARGPRGVEAPPEVVVRPVTPPSRPAVVAPRADEPAPASPTTPGVGPAGGLAAGAGTPMDAETGGGVSDPWSVLTEEELSMLLSEDWPEDDDDV